MILFLINVSVAWAVSVAVPEPNVTDTEYRAFLAAHPEHLTPSDSITRSRPSVAARENLVALYADAQRTFLEGTPSDARLRFDQVLTQVHSEDWAESEREALFNSALRRAQIALNEDDQRKWLLLAISLGSGLRIDEKLYPPPLIQAYQFHFNAAPKRKLSIEGLGKDWSAIIVNGVKCSLERCPEFADSGLPVRVTFISDRWQPFMKVKPLSQVSKEIPVRKAWLAGNCQKPLLDAGATQLPNPQPFFGIGCEESRINHKQMNFHPVTSAHDKAGITMFKEPKNDRPFYKSPWLWAGVGTVIAILVVQSQQQKDDKKEPSTTYGLQ